MRLNIVERSGELVGFIIGGKEFSLLNKSSFAVANEIRRFISTVNESVYFQTATQEKRFNAFMLSCGCSVEKYLRAENFSNTEKVEIITGAGSNNIEHSSVSRIRITSNEAKSEWKLGDKHRFYFDCIDDATNTEFKFYFDVPSGKWFYKGEMQPYAVNELAAHLIKISKNGKKIASLQKDVTAA